MKNALIIGASGGIGSALKTAYSKNNIFGVINTLTRSKDSFDISDEKSVTRALENQDYLYDVVIIATGGVEINNNGPEKTIKKLSANNMIEQFSLNAVGPALILKHIHKLIPKSQSSHVIILSAKVGSISDNRLGGWISYRTAKAALNQIVRTSAIEIKRTHPKACLLAVHPGTVDTNMTKNYTSHAKVSAEKAANNIINLTKNFDANDSGNFFDWAGKIIPW